MYELRIVGISHSGLGKDKVQLCLGNQKIPTFHTSIFLLRKGIKVIKEVLKRRICGMVNSTHAGKLEQPQQALLLVYFGCRSTRDTFIFQFTGRSSMQYTSWNVVACVLRQARLWQRARVLGHVYCGAAVHVGMPQLECFYTVPNSLQFH